MTIVVFPPAGIGILPVSQLPDARVIMLASLGVRLVSLLGLLVGGISSGPVACPCFPAVFP